MIHGDRNATVDAHVGGRPRGFGNSFGRAPDALVNVFLHRIVERAYCADQARRIGNDVETHARLELAHGHDGGLRRDVHLTADDRLKGQDDLRPDDHRIHACPRRGAVRLSAPHRDLEPIGCGHDRPAAPSDMPRRHICKNVKTEDRVDLRVLEHALRDHQLGARRPLIAWRTLFGRLEDELHRAPKLPFQLAENPRRREQHGHVSIVSARVHHANALALVFARCATRERQIDGLGHRQGIHVGAQRDDGPGLRAAQQRRHARSRHARLRLEAKAPQRVRDESGCLWLSIRELRMLVQVTTPRQQLLLDGGGPPVDLGRERRGRGHLRPGGLREAQDREDEEKGLFHVGCSRRARASARRQRQRREADRSVRRSPGSGDRASGDRLRDHALLRREAGRTDREAPPWGSALHRWQFPG